MNNIVQSKYGTINIGKKVVTKSYTYDYFDLMLREYALSNLLKKFTGVCGFNEIDCVNFKLKRPNYGISLMNWLTTKHRKNKDKRTILLQIINIVANIHSYRIVHGNLKMENIIINKGHFGKITVYIVNLSHANLEEYVDYTLTSPLYQEPSPSGQTSHDIWSLGIIALELYTETVLAHAPTMDEIKILLDIIPLDIQSVVRDMLKKDKRSRITAIQALIKLEMTSIQYIPKFTPLIHYKMIAEGNSFAEWYCQETKNNGIIRKEYGLAAIIHYIHKNNIPPDYYAIYSIGMLIILTSLFSGECTLEWSSRKTEYSHAELLAVINSIITDEDIINILYMYDKAEELFNDVNSPRGENSSRSSSASRDDD